ncbi:MAG: AmmeMemoRadiSam system protein B [Candidatus Omnitrophota bacterium]
MARKTIAAGQFYPLDKEVLSRDLDGLVPENSEKIDAIGAIIPHAGYIYSGAVAGEMFAKIVPKDTYIILGPNHTGYGLSFASSNESWETPFGEIEIDEELLDAIRNGTSLIKDDISAHIAEHSIEVQLPFIKRTSPNAKIVPITVKHGEIGELKEIAAAISEAVKTIGSDAIVIASSDMTHYESRENAIKKDTKAIEKVLSLDAEGLYEVVENNNISMCGYVPSVIMLMTAKHMGAKEGRLVKYSDSGEVTGDVGQVVGYAGIAVY